MPSLDKLFCSVSSFKSTLQGNFMPEDVVVKTVFKPVSRSEELAIVFLPWHSPDWYGPRLAAQQNAVGRSVLYLEYRDELLSADPAITLDSARVLSGAYYEAIAKLAHTEPTHWRSYSLGNALMFHALGTQDIPHPTIDIVASGGDLAVGLWTGYRTRPIRAAMEATGLTLPDLQEQWLDLSPIEQASSIHGSTVGIRLSHADAIVRPDSGFELAVALSEAGNTVDVRINRYLGHYATLLTDVL